MNKCEHTFLPNFVYSNVRENPYHHKLGESEFSNFVYRDHEGEYFRGLWNEEAFKRIAPIHVEVGCGYGDFLIHFCNQNPQVNFVALDYRFKRGHQVAKKLITAIDKSKSDKSDKSDESGHYKFLRAKGERISYLFAENEIDNMYLFFPDPWPKLRHHKKRLFNQFFLESLYVILKPGGRLFFKTDHDGYFEWALEQVKLTQLADKFKLTFHTHDLWQKDIDIVDSEEKIFLNSFATKFEKIFISQDIKVKALTIETLKSTLKPILKPTLES
ncbi:MAG: hypothetical protein HQK51_07735 [Oligoflexia bacterium]|nr:hypothetical protein [Oligoflexia bacterium]